jgi:hypothetical protein
MMAEEPTMPASPQRMCMEPPRPPQNPSVSPMISAMARRTSTPAWSGIASRRGS